MFYYQKEVQKEWKIFLPVDSDSPSMVSILLESSSAEFSLLCIVVANSAKLIDLFVLYSVKVISSQVIVAHATNQPK